MQIEFEKEYLKELYETGKTTKKKYRFQYSLVEQYKNTIDKLKYAVNIEELFFSKSLNYERLSGKKQGTESVRVNNKYRIEFISNTPNSNPTITICSIIELSNHYK
jgi:toxin HigB-1